MAAVGGVACGGNVCLQRYNNTSSDLFNPGAPSCSLMMLSSKPRTSKILATTSSSSSSNVGIQSLPRQTERKRKEFSYEKIDDWMRDSVADIVRKLPESPLLIHVYSDEDKTTKTRAEKAEEEKWVSMKQKWKKGESRMPDGVIFVEQIQEQGEGEKNAWGIVVQGRKGEPPACYLLKTSKVSSGFGLRCTHFCLVKVTSFSETAFSQLKNCWLLQAN